MVEQDHTTKHKPVNSILVQETPEQDVIQEEAVTEKCIPEVYKLVFSYFFYRIFAVFFIFF